MHSHTLPTLQSTCIPELETEPFQIPNRAFFHEKFLPEKIYRVVGPRPHGRDEHVTRSVNGNGGSQKEGGVCPEFRKVEKYKLEHGTR